MTFDWDLEIDRIVSDRETEIMVDFALSRIDQPEYATGLRIVREWADSMRKHLSFICPVKSDFHLDIPEQIE